MCVIEEKFGLFTLFHCTAMVLILGRDQRCDVRGRCPSLKSKRKRSVPGEIKAP
jgi:hypothetical protein